MRILLLKLKKLFHDKVKLLIVLLNFELQDLTKLSLEVLLILHTISISLQTVKVKYILYI